MDSEREGTHDPHVDAVPEVETHVTIRMNSNRMRVLMRALRTCDYSWDHNRKDILEMRLMIKEGSRKH